MKAPTEACECGHVYDEHDGGADCEAEYAGEPCGCVYFDAAAPTEEQT